ncbi:hypothetical protein POTOM_028325 [Populus tomentosa]|uniref:non-specific serine/threonine protein kinase n=1 Tax=Populus tomentosa TaxID=118781 RepID=A0A8X7ZD72_POPTO|nr:hypothetical protein POTOM_028325 [Populus tomentosa]
MIRHPFLLPFLTLSFVCIIGLAAIAQAQNQTQPTTDPDEARALNSIFQQWRISATNQWNTSGDVCSGAATGASPTIDDKGFNPFIKCDCNFLNGTTCRITALYVLSLPTLKKRKRVSKHKHWRPETHLLETGDPFVGTIVEISCEPSLEVRKVYAMDVIGLIPDELWSLVYLTNLNLGQNYLTGNLSSSISNLTRMQYLTFGINALSGELPKELGLLTDLRVLSFSSNNFTGSLPSELGNLVKLEQIYFDSSGVSGEIPPTFANLQNLANVWASDNELTGRIPDFIGNWSKLIVLRFEGNAFEGPIPSVFSNLTTLTELRISDLSDGGTSLEFIKNMKSLSILVLRNDNISASIPSYIGEFQSLTQLDLSFNNIEGQIPDSLFNLSSLTYLFLGNNKLNGTLPATKSSGLLNVDVSYNNLAGGFPSWVSETNLELNLVANNFTVVASNLRSSNYLPHLIFSGLPSGLNCLQRNFPCNRGSPIYSQFGIKCGGPQITSSNRVLFERDNTSLAAASYYVSDASTFGVSNTGYFSGNSDPQYTTSSSSQFTNTLDSELFQTSRISASSLRYYGLGLQNGNYTIIMQFTESVILQGSTWKSLGRRVFDVYIQGSRVLKDFDIQKAAGGITNQAVQREFKVQVTENYVDIHFFWAGKGTCCIPAQGTYGPSVSAINAIPDFTPTVSNKLPSEKKKKNRTGLIAGIVVGVGVVGFLLVFSVLFARRRERKSNIDYEEFLGIDARPYTFSFGELKTATEDFSSANKLGEGGFGPVYKGKLNDGRVIAVKQLSVASHQGKAQFIAEIATISAVQHRNLVKLYGCCIEGANRLLVYEYLENKSLDQAVFGEQSLNLDWPTRYDICLGVARGLAYLHEESRIRIVHRDVKASNILLDFNLIPKISDFGLAKLYDDKKTHISTRVAGTIGYLAPEYAMRGHLTEKADVFAFGVVALEIISGRPNSDTSLETEKIYLLEWVCYIRYSHLSHCKSFAHVVEMGCCEERQQGQELQCPKKMMVMETVELCMKLLGAIVMVGVAWSQ